MEGAPQSTPPLLCSGHDQVITAHGNQLTKKKDKRGTMQNLCCDICNVAVSCPKTFQSHLNGKKHQVNLFLAKSCDGNKYIKRYKYPDDKVYNECELCGVPVLNVVNHFNSPVHILAFLKVNYPKAYENLPLRGSQKISRSRLMKIMQYGHPEVKALLSHVPFKQDMLAPAYDLGTSWHEDLQLDQTDVTALQTRMQVNSDNPMMIEGNLYHTGIRRNEDCEPPPKMLRMDDPPCKDICDTISEKNSGVDKKENKDSESDERLIKSESEDYKECKTGCDFKSNGFESKITCKKDFYNFLQSFQVTDETDVIFIQQIAKKFKSQLQEFYENAKTKKATIGLNEDNNQQKDPAQGALQQTGTTGSCIPVYDASNTLNVGKLKSIISPSILNSALTSSQSQLKDVANVSIKKEPESVFSPPIPILNPNSDKLILKETIKSPSSPLCSRELCERKKNLSVSAEITCLASPDFIVSSQDQIPVKTIVAPLNIKTEPPLSNADVSCTSSLKAANSPIIKFSHSDFSTSDVSTSASLHNSCSKQSPAGIYSTFRELPKMYSTNVPLSVQNPFSASKENAASSLSGNKDEQAIASTVCTSQLCCRQPSQESSPKFSKPEKSEPCNVSYKLPKFTYGCCSSKTCSTKTLGHPSMSKLSRAQTLSMYLDFLTANKNKLVPAVEKPSISHLNALHSPMNTYDTYSTTFGGKENVHISELIAEVAKFADTKPVLKGIDINHVVRILIQNRNEKTRKESNNSTL